MEFTGGNIDINSDFILKYKHATGKLNMLFFQLTTVRFYVPPEESKYLNLNLCDDIESEVTESPKGPIRCYIVTWRP